MFDARSDELTGSAASTGAGLAGVLDDLAAVTAAVAGVSFAEVPEQSVKDALVALDGCRNRLDAACAHVAGVFDAQAMWAGDGARSSAGWIAAHAEAARGSAVRDVKLGRALIAMPETDAALPNGSLGVAKARLLADAAHHAPDAFGRDESLLVGNARGLRVDAAKSMLEFWKARANPDDAGDAEQRRFEARAVFLSQTLDGMWRLDGMLPGELGEILAGELDRRSRALYESDRSQADASGTPLARTAAQRRADALVEMALHASVDEDGATINRPAVTAVIHVDQVTDPFPLPPKRVGPMHPPPGAGRRCGGRMLASRTQRPPRRRPPHAIRPPRPRPVPGSDHHTPPRRTLHRCTFPGCDRPPGWTNAHHLVHWINDGPTDLQNLTLLCAFHHHRVHEGGFTCQRMPDGNLEFRRPDGTPLTVPKQRHPM